MDGAHVVAVLRWRSPRSVPPPAAVHAMLVEAGRLGILGAGALSDAGRALLLETAPLVGATPTPPTRSPPRCPRPWTRSCCRAT